MHDDQYLVDVRRQIGIEEQRLAQIRASADNELRRLNEIRHEQNKLMSGFDDLQATYEKSSLAKIKEKAMEYDAFVKKYESDLAAAKKLISDSKMMSQDAEEKMSRAKHWMTEQVIQRAKVLGLSQKTDAVLRSLSEREKDVVRIESEADLLFREAENAVHTANENVKQMLLQLDKRSKIVSDSEKKVSDLSQHLAKRFRALEAREEQIQEENERIASEWRSLVHAKEYLTKLQNV